MADLFSRCFPYFRLASSQLLSHPLTWILANIKRTLGERVLWDRLKDIIGGRLRPVKEFLCINEVPSYYNEIVYYEGDAQLKNPPVL